MARLVIILLGIVASLLITQSQAQIPIPHRPLGFVYRNGSHNASVHMDVFLDLECPDSKMAFPVMKSLAEKYGSKVLRIKFFIFPLPYHRNSFLAAQGAQIAYTAAKSMNGDDAVMTWIQATFDKQIQWSTSSTALDNLMQVEKLLASYAMPLGISSQDFLQMMNDRDLNENARIMWKYGCTRGVAGTPWFFVNGVMVAADASWTVDQWKQLIDPLLK